MTRSVSQTLTIMRRAIGRKNTNDPDASPEVLLSYLNDFYSLTMSDDVKLFELFGTLSFVIDETTETGIITLAEAGAQDGTSFVNISMEAFISFAEPANNSTSWNELQIYQDPGEFYSIWGINNQEILVRGYPTMMLYYGTDFVFRTLPDQEYLINIYGYKQNADFPDSTGDLPHDYWMRYLAYGAAVNYAADFRYPPDQIALIEKTFARERVKMLTRTHNQLKRNRAFPRF
jgi:hypothetical protein